MSRDQLVIGTPWGFSGYWHALGTEWLLAYLGDFVTIGILWGLSGYWHALGTD